ncbi:MAG TPA: cytochrome C peroxidase, partial [Byssovorax sp.]
MRARPILALASIALAGCGAAPPPVAPAAISPPATTKAAADDAPAAALSALPDARAGGAVALARTPDGRTLAFVADEDGRALVTFDLDRGAVVAETPLDGAPAQVLVLARGGVAVTLRDASAVVLLAAQRGADAPLVERARRAVAADAFGLATSPDGARLLVTSGAGSRLAILGARDLDLEAEITLAREPRAVVVEPTGKRAFVSHAVGARLSSIDLDARAVSTIDLTTRTANRWGEPTRRTGDQGFALAWAAWSARPGAPAHGRLFAPAASVEPGEGVFTTAVYGAANGAPVLPVVHVVDPARGVTIGREIALPTSGAPGDRCNLPRAAAVASASLFVACLGLDAVLELDAR